MAELSAVGPGDYAPLADFLANFPDLPGAREFWLSRFALWWDENPAFSAEHERGWLLRDGGEIAGFLAHVPSWFQCGGRKLVVFAASTWMVRAANRDESMTLYFRQAAAAKDSILFNATPTDGVAKILARTGFKLYPWGENRESFVLLNAARGLRAKLGGGLAGLAAGAVAPLFEALQARRLRALDGSVYRVENPARADESFDVFWERTRGAHDNTNVRTAAVLNWHCVADKAVEKKLFACYDGARLVAYAITRPRWRRGLNTLECADLWLDPAHPGAVAALIACVRDYGRRRSLDLISFPHFSRELGAIYRKLGLLEAGLPPRRGYYRAAPALASAVENGRSYFVGLQGDAGTSP